jgi:hypothetical protein
MSRYIPFFKESLSTDKEIVSMTFKVRKIGSKWIQCNSSDQNMTAHIMGYLLNWFVEKTDETKDWKVGQIYTLDVLTDITRSPYGDRRVAYPVSTKKDDDKLKDLIIKRFADLKKKITKNWNSNIEDSIIVLINKLKNVKEKENLELQLKQLKDGWHKNFYMSEINRILEYLKKNIDRFWWRDGEITVLRYAKKLEQFPKYAKIINNLKKEYEKKI